MSSSLPVVRQGAFCRHPGAEGVTVSNTPMVCELSGDGRYHWQGKTPTPASGGFRRPAPRSPAPPPRRPAQQETLPIALVVDLTPAPATLTDDDRKILAFESRPWPKSGVKESAIGAELKMSPTRYYQTLNRLIDHPAALAAHPQMLGRLRRIRDGRRRRCQSR